jgi:hypothetical protein
MALSQLEPPINRIAFRDIVESQRGPCRAVPSDVGLIPTFAGPQSQSATIRRVREHRNDGGPIASAICLNEY